MKNFTFNDGHTIPVIGTGTNTYGKPDGVFDAPINDDTTELKSAIALGYRMIDTAIMFARHENALRISLETQKTNRESHRLYEAMGFIADNEFRTYHCFLK